MLPGFKLNSVPFHPPPPYLGRWLCNPLPNPTRSNPGLGSRSLRRNLPLSQPQPVIYLDKALHVFPVSLGGLDFFSSPPPSPLLPPLLSPLASAALSLQGQSWNRIATFTRFQAFGALFSHRESWKPPSVGPPKQKHMAAARLGGPRREARSQRERVRQRQPGTPAIRWLRRRRGDERRSELEKRRGI